MKRKLVGDCLQRAVKRGRLAQEPSSDPSYPLLRGYYTRVLTLRQYLALELSSISRNRQRKIQVYGKHRSAESDPQVAELLDATVVGTLHNISEDHGEIIAKDITVFTQHLNISLQGPSLTPGVFKQSEIVDFVIWLLFRRCPLGQRPQHLLCQGFQKFLTAANGHHEPLLELGIPGIFSAALNEQVRSLKSYPWNGLPDLLGQSSEQILSNLFLHCGIFTPLGSNGSLVQISGTPMSDLPLLRAQPVLVEPNGKSIDPKLGVKQGRTREGRGLVEIRLVRHRMLYARPQVNAKGSVQFGLPRIHVLNRLDSGHTGVEAYHLTRYVFPAQYGLHNVLNSDTDRKDTAHQYKDYSVREQEITRLRQAQLHRRGGGLPSTKSHSTFLPRRLRGKPHALVHCIWHRHSKCPYSALLNHYCPRVLGPRTGSSYEYAVPVSNVSAFCRAVIRKVFPKDFWGSGETLEHNSRRIFGNVDRFVRLRRFESLTLHDIMQEIKVTGIEWLETPKATSTARLSYTDWKKRQELMAELLYYLFDSFLMPLIRGHFHVTETSVNRNQIKYFRHDVWREISEPALTSLKTTILEECKGMSVKSMLSRRTLGVSSVRLLPKESGMRPIINLRRRMQRLQNGQIVLGKSINGILTPVFSVLNYEKEADPGLLGSALFSVDDVFPRLHQYRESLRRQGLDGRPLYFAKVDVQACFDTIPQRKLLQVAHNIITEERYQIFRYSRARLVGHQDRRTPGFGSKPSWRFRTKARPSKDVADFRREIESDVEHGQHRAVYISGTTHKQETRGDLIRLLNEHVESNLLRIGKRFYRQKEGIPQGSIVSSLLCSYFYAELEHKVLGFLADSNHLLLRLIDDFLVITTDRSIAERFMRTMHDGIPEFGVAIKTDKSRANFDIECGGKAITRLPQVVDFPYCGNVINTVTLNLSKDMERRRKIDLADTLTVEYSRIPGQTFYRKTLNALKLQMNAMHLSTTHNSVGTVFMNLYHSFAEVASKSFHYIRTLPRARQPAGKLCIRAVEDLIKLARGLMRRGQRGGKGTIAYECAVTNVQAEWLACTAFNMVFSRRQTKHAELLQWLQRRLETPALRTQRKLLGPIVSSYGLGTSSRTDRGKWPETSQTA